VASTRLSDPMITALLDTLRHRRTDDGRYETFAPVHTRNALVARGKVVRTQEYRNNEGEWVVRWYLTEEGITHLRETLTYVLSKGEERDAVWTEWLNAERRNRNAVIDFLGLTADSYDFTATTPLNKRNPRRETLNRTDTHEHIGSAMADGWRITLSDNGLTATNALGASWTFKPLGFAVEIERTSYERHTGAHGLGWARKIGTDNPASVRYMIDRAGQRGDAVTVEDGGVIRVDNAGRVDPSYDGAGEPCPVWFVPVRQGAPAVDLATLPTADDVIDAPHTVYVDGERRHDGISAAHVRKIVGNLRFKRQAFTQDTDGAICVESRRYVPVRPAVEEQHDRAEEIREEVTAEAEARPCLGCGAEAGEPCEPMSMCEVAREEAVSARLAEEPPTERDYAQEAAELLGDGERWVKHFRVFGRDPKIEKADRATALALIVWARREGWQVYRADAGGVNLESPTGESSYWLEPAAEERPQLDEEAVNRAARFLPQDEEDTRPCVEIGTVQVYAYRKGGRLVVSVDLDGVDTEGGEIRDDGTVPMVITVQGREVFEG
jgi:hypothetical protein